MNELSTKLGGHYKGVHVAYRKINSEKSGNSPNFSQSGSILRSLINPYSLYWAVGEKGEEPDRPTRCAARRPGPAEPPHRPPSGLRSVGSLKLSCVPAAYRCNPHEQVKMQRC